MEVNSSMTIKKFLAGSLSSVMVLSCLNIGVAELEPNALDDATINQLKATAQNEIEHFFRESDEDLYSLVGFRFDDSEVTQSDGLVQYETTVTVKHRALKKCRTSLAIWMNSALLRMPQWPHPIRRSWQNPLSA